MKHLKITYLLFVIPFLLVGCGQPQSSSLQNSEENSSNLLKSLEGEQGQNCAGADTSVMALNRTHVHLSGNSYIEGSLTLSSGEASLHASGRALVDGDLIRESASETKFSGNAGVGGSEVIGDYSAYFMEAEQTSVQLSTMVATQSFEEIRDSGVIPGNGGVNVISIEDDIHLSGKDKLTLSGTADDIFILNIGGDVKLSGKSALALDGVDPKKVLIHLSGASSRIHLSGGAEVYGSVLTLSGDVHLSGGSVLTGAVSAGGDSIHVSGRGQILGESNYCPGRPNPEPEPQPEPEPEPQPEPEPEPQPEPEPEPEQEEPQADPEPEEPGKPDNF